MQPRELIWRDLEAVLVIDDTTLGPAVGGTRTRAYATEADMVSDARALARAMTLKCALGGLEAGGCKIVVRAQPDMDRGAIFEEIGRRIQALGGEVRTAGDLGTTLADLERMAAHCDFIHLDERGLAASAARGCVRCMEACAAMSGRPLARVAVQGAGAIGSAVARALRERGTHVLIADIDPQRAVQVASELDAEVIAPEAILTADVDVVAPCAIGGVIDAPVVEHLRAWALVGAANNILAHDDVADELRQREILYVPDVIASAGAVVDGVGATIMGLDDRTALVDRLGEVAAEVLDEAARDDISTVAVAARLAAARLGRG